jgi:hypothetical protein
MSSSTSRSDPHADPSAPVILGYAACGPAGPWRWRWLMAAALGLAIGAAGGFFAYGPMLAFIAQGQAVSIGSANQFIPAQVRFAIASAIGGLVVACGAVAAAGRRKMWFGWPILLAIIFRLAASLGLLAVRAKFDQTLAYASGYSSYIFLPRGYAAPVPNSVISFNFHVSYRLVNSIALIAPTFGCVAVLLVLILLAILRFFGRPPRRDSAE